MVKHQFDEPGCLRGLHFGRTGRSFVGVRVADWVRADLLFRQLPRPETQERRDHGDQDAGPEWNRLTADDYLHLVEETEKMEESKDCEKRCCHP